MLLLCVEIMIVRPDVAWSRKKELQGGILEGVGVLTQTPGLRWIVVEKKYERREGTQGRTAAVSALRRNVATPEKTRNL